MSRSGAQAWLNPHRLEYVPLNDELAVLRVLAGVKRGIPVPVSPALVAGAPHTIVRAPYLGSVTHQVPRRMRTADHLLWRVTFALPIELLECPETVFALAAGDRLPTRLPTPELSTLEALCRHWELGPRGASLISDLTWRRAVALGTTVAFAGSSVASPALALAAGHHSRALASHHLGRHAHHAAAPATTAPPAHVAVAKHLSTVAGSSAHASASTDLAQRAAAHATHRQHHRHHHKTGHVPVPHQPTSTTTSSTPTPPATPRQPTGTSTPGSGAHPSVSSTRHHSRHHQHAGGHTDTSTGGSGLSTISPVAPAGLLGSHHGTGHDSTGGSRHSHTSGGRRHRHKGHHDSVPSGTGSRSALTGGGSLPSLKPHPAHRLHPTALVPQPAPSTSALTPSSSNFTPGTGLSPAEAALMNRLAGLYTKALKPPSFLIPIYKAAGKRFHIPWQVLAAINSIETDYGRNLNVSSAGAVGWMQFMPSTWAHYGISVGGRGTPNPYDPTDAIFSAAHYLAVNGGAHHLHRAIFAYNHANWYVYSVMWRAEQILQHTARPNASSRTKISEMLTAARLLDGTPYVYGGGHAGWGPSIGYDCSGFVSAVLHAAGYLTIPVNTQALPGQPGILAGPGKWVTLFDRTDAGSNDHVVIDINGHFWESGGSSTAGGGPRVHPIAHMSLSYLASFNRILHPRGL